MNIISYVVIGIVGTLVFIFLFPGGSITTAMHDVLELPGPGAGIGLILGPFVIVLTILSFHLIPRRGTIFLTCISFAVFHSTLTPLLNPDVKTAGSIGPLHLRILALVLLGLILEMCIFLLSRKNIWLRFVTSSIISNIALIVFYWVAIFPDTKGWVAPEDVPVLLGITILSALIFSAAITFAFRRIFGKP